MSSGAGQQREVDSDPALALFTHGDTVRIEHGHGPDLVGASRIGRGELPGDLVHLIARIAVHYIEAE